MFLSGLVLVVFDIKNDSTLDQIHGSEEVISNTIFRLASYTDIYAFYLDLWQTTIGLVDNHKCEQYGMTNTVMGNLCELYPNDDTIFANYCQNIAEGAATKGTLVLHTYYVVGLHSVQQCYNFSAKTWDGSKKCLGLQYIVDAEAINPCMYWAFQNIDSIIKAEALKNYNWLQGFVKRVVGAYMVGSFIGW